MEIKGLNYNLRELMCALSEHPPPIPSVCQDLLGLVDSLPVEGMDLILGNNISGGRMGVLPVVSEKPVDKEMQVVDEMSDLFPVCGVTWAQFKRMKMETQDGRRDLSIANLFF